MNKKIKVPKSSLISAMRLAIDGREMLIAKLIDQILKLEDELKEAKK